MTDCTWVYCPKPGTAPQRDVNGRQWACLCAEHARQLDAACDLTTGHPQRLLAAWINAQGGHKAAAARMAADVRPPGR